MTLRDNMDDRNVTDTHGRPVSFCPYCGAKIIVGGWRSMIVINRG